jgi:hypothetical protein
MTNDLLLVFGLQFIVGLVSRQYNLDYDKTVWAKGRNRKGISYCPYDRLIIYSSGIYYIFGNRFLCTLVGSIIWLESV